MSGSPRGRMWPSTNDNAGPGASLRSMSTTMSTSETSMISDVPASPSLSPDDSLLYCGPPPARPEVDNILIYSLPPSRLPLVNPNSHHHHRPLPPLCPLSFKFRATFRGGNVHLTQPPPAAPFVPAMCCKTLSSCSCGRGSNGKLQRARQADGVVGDVDVARR